MPSAAPYANIQRISIDYLGPADKTRIQSSVNIKMTFPTNPVVAGGFLTQKQVMDSFRILLVQITKESSLDAIAAQQNDKMRAEWVWRHYQDEDYISAHRFFETDSHVVNLNEDGVYEVVFKTEAPFIITPEEGQHLSYVAIPYYDTCPNPILGTPTIELVMEQGQIAQFATAFYLGGQPYTGAVTKRLDGSFLAADDNNKLLTSKPVINSIIHDLRIYTDLSETFISTKFQKPTKPSIFSELFLTRGVAGEVKYLFSYDALALGIQASDHPWMYSNPIFKQSLLDNLEIKLLALSRQRKAKNINLDYLPFDEHFENMIEDYYIGDENEQRKIIASSKDTSHGFLPTENIVESKEGEPELIGNIKEIELADNTQNIRTFTGVDFSAKDLSQAEYEYSAALAVDDPSASLLHALTEDLLGVISDLTEYETLSVPNYNSSTEFFRKYFHTEVNSAVLEKSLKTYVTVLDDLATAGLPIPQIALRLFTLISPKTGTVENIGRTIILVRKLVAFITSILEPETKSVEEGGESKTKNKATPKTNTFKILNRFKNETLNTAVPSNIGTKYLSNLNEGDLDGLSVISLQDYETTVQQQVAALFKQGGQTSFGITSKFSISPLLYKNDFLRAEEITMVGSHGSTETFNLAQTNNDFYDSEKHNYVFLKMLAHAIGLDLELSLDGQKINPDFSETKQKLRDVLIQLASFTGITIESMESFKTESNVDYDLVDSVDEDSSSSTDANSAQSEQNAADQGKLELDETNPISILFNNMILNYAPELQKHTPFNPDFYDLSSQTIFPFMTQHQLDRMPSQIKALFTLCTLPYAAPLGSPATATYSTILNFEGSQIQNAFALPLSFIYNMFLNTVSVKVLTGYNGTIKQPVFQSFSEADINTSGLALCKLERFSGLGAFGVENYPVYDDTFLLELQQPLSDYQSATIDVVTEEPILGSVAAGLDTMEPAPLPSVAPISGAPAAAVAIAKNLEKTHAGSMSAIRNRKTLTQQMKATADDTTAAQTVKTMIQMGLGQAGTRPEDQVEDQPLQFVSALKPNSRITVTPHAKANGLIPPGFAFVGYYPDIDPTDNIPTSEMWGRLKGTPTLPVTTLNNQHKHYYYVNSDGNGYAYEFAQAGNAGKGLHLHRILNFKIHGPANQDWVDPSVADSNSVEFAVKHQLSDLNNYYNNYEAKYGHSWHPHMPLLGGDSQLAGQKAPIPDLPPFEDLVEDTSAATSQYSGLKNMFKF